MNSEEMFSTKEGHVENRTTELQISQTSLPSIDIIKKAITNQETGVWGSITKIAEEYGTSRKTIYEHLNKGNKALELAFTESEKPDSKIYGQITIDQNHLERSIVALYAGGVNSIRSIVHEVEILYGFHISYGKVQSILSEACERAQKFNESIDLSRISHCALDEMFSQGNPVLGGIDVDTHYTFVLNKAKGRSGDDWECELKKPKDLQGLDPDVVIKDAGTGLRDGVSRVFPTAQQRDDIFHAMAKMSKAQSFYERRALTVLNEEWELEQNLKQTTKKSKRISLVQKLRHCRDRCEKLMYIHDTFEKLCKTVPDWMEFIDGETGELRTGKQCAQKLKQAAMEMKKLNIPRIKSVANYLYKRADSLCLWVDELMVDLKILKESLADKRKDISIKPSIMQRVKNLFINDKQKSAWTDEEIVRACCWFWKFLDKQEKCTCDWDKRRLLNMAAGLYRLIKKQIGDYADDLIARAISIIKKRYRASSIIESLNSLLRPYLYVHKGVTQEFLNLFMAYRNLKKQGCGEIKGLSPYELLTGERFDDWLSLIGYPPTKAVV